MKAHLAIYNLNDKADRWWMDLKNTKKEELRKIWWSKFRNIFQEKYLSKIFFNRKVKEFHELHMGSMTMDSFINIFLDLLHYVAHIKEEREKIERLLEISSSQFLGKD